MPALAVPADQIVITASRTPEAEAQSPASVSILDQVAIERLGEPQVVNLLRLTPSVSVTVSGPTGSFSEVRIRGAEVNHTLLFIDGIKINDPSSGDTPRFEVLNADLASRIEVVRGPQSALWGSEAIGGVIAINGTHDAPGYAGSVEAGSFGSARASSSAAWLGSRASAAAAIGWQRATGIDSFDGHGDKDGYRNLSARLRGAWSLTDKVQIGASAVALTGRSEFDGYDPVTFVHTDTLDRSRNRLGAGRLWVRVGGAEDRWSAQVAASLLGSSNRNYLADDQINRTSGKRKSLSGQVNRRFATGPLAHLVVLAAEAEQETFSARDAIYGGFSNQDRKREHKAFTAEWRAEAPWVTADIAVRRDMFDKFKDASTVRASLLAPLGKGWALAGAYSEGIAQPTFFDLYGFFPGSYIGNPDLKPESSRGFEVALRYRAGRLAGSLTAYRQRLHDEIVDVYDPNTFSFSAENRKELSRRSGLEAEASWSVGDALRIGANYAYLHATQPDDAEGRAVRELRRPKHSGAVTLDGMRGRMSYGASIAYVGKRLDRRDIYPFDRVSLNPYVLASARAAYTLSRGVELFGRVSNAFNSSYQDVFGYRTEGRGGFVGLRLTGR